MTDNRSGLQGKDISDTIPSSDLKGVSGLGSQTGNLGTSNLGQGGFGNAGNLTGGNSGLGGSSNLSGQPGTASSGLSGQGGVGKKDYELDKNLCSPGSSINK
jgi:hypothetical protein